VKVAAGDGGNDTDLRRETVEQFREFLGRVPAGKPFFLQLCWHDPHRPFTNDQLPYKHDPATLTLPPFYPDSPTIRADLAAYYDEVARMGRLMIDSIAAAIDEFDPAIVWLDPWYAYAPGSAVASSALLTDIGQVLSNWRQAVGVGRTAMINHHLNTGGTGDGLQRLAGAGHAEWCDSWMLVDHREKPQVEEGRFRLKLRVGSRQWGGGDYAIDLNLGRFDPEQGIHIGSIHWKVGRLAEAQAETDEERHQTTMTETQLAIKRYLRKQQRPVGRNELIEGVGAKKERVRAALDILIERGEVIERALKVAGASGRPKIMCSLTEDQ